MRKTLAFLSLVWLVLQASPLFAHPHLFIKPFVGFVVAKEEIEGVRIRWEWDEWWSEDVTSHCDSDRDKTFNPKEQRKVKSDFFDGVKDFHYFTTIRMNKKKIGFGEAQKFAAMILPNGTIAYEFTLPLKDKQPLKGSMEICFNDDTIYTAFDEDAGLLGEKKYVKKKTSGPFGDYGVRLLLAF